MSCSPGRWSPLSACLVPLLLAACSDVSTVAPASSIPAPTSPPPIAPTRHLESIGIQLYTLRALLQQDFEGTLRRVAAMGYREVEFAGLFGNDPARVKALLTELNLVAVGSHVDWKRIRDDSAGAIEETRALGSHYLVLPSLPEGERRTLAAWQSWIDVLNRVGAACLEQGLELAYHNHAFEFVPVEGVVPYDLLLERLDHTSVKMELDLFWLATGGREPGPLFDAYPGIFPLAHVKDMRLSDRSMADVGQGDLDFAGVFARADQAGMQYFIVEHDTPSDPLASAHASLTHLQNLAF